MIDIIFRVGISGSIGLLLGIFVNFWVEPEKPEGAGFILLFFVLVAVIFDTIFNSFKKLLTKKPSPPPTPKEKQQKRSIWLPGDGDR